MERSHTIHTIYEEADPHHPDPVQLAALVHVIVRKKDIFLSVEHGPEITLTVEGAKICLCISRKGYEMEMHADNDEGDLVECDIVLRPQEKESL